MPLAHPAPDGGRFARVIKTEEKGSDVNLASQLVSDAYEDHFDVAVLITNDSDLLMPIEIVRRRLGRTVGLFNPQRRAANVLRNAASFLRPIRAGVLRAAQFPDRLVDANGPFQKPRSW
jgi:hypothetical protein